MSKTNNSPRGGYTVIELLAVILILAAFMCAMMPAFINAMSDSKRMECRANMRTIANGMREYLLKDGGTLNHTPTYPSSIATLQNKVSVNVVCPTGGTYSVTPSGTAGTPGYNFTVACSDSTHNAGYGSEPSGYTPGSNTQ